MVPIAGPLLKAAVVMARVASSGCREDQEARKTTEQKLLLRAQLSALRLLNGVIVGLRRVGLLKQRRIVGWETSLDVELLVRVILGHVANGAPSGKRVLLRPE